MKKAITVKFPAPMPAEIPCPVCSKEQGRKGSGCIACNFSGRLKITVDAKIPIQQGHIVKYVADNLTEFSAELTKLTGLVPQVETVDVVDSQLGKYEIVQISSIGGAVWIANRLDDFAAPRYMYSLKDLKDFKEGYLNER